MPAAWIGAGAAVYTALNKDDGAGGAGGAGFDPRLAIREQGAIDRDNFLFRQNNGRISSRNPMGTSTWKNNATFDQGGYDAALGRFNQDRFAFDNRQNLRAIQDASGGGFQPAPYSDQDYPSSSYRTPGSMGGTALGTAPQETFTQTAPDRKSFEGPAAWENTQAFNPDEQRIFDNTTSKYGEAVRGISTNADNYNSSVADAVYRRTRRYQDVEDAKSRSAQQSNLADRGFAVGNEAYASERTRLDDSINKGIADSADRAQITGFTQGQAQLTMQQQIAQTLAGLRGGQMSGLTGLPSTVQTPNLQSPDLYGALRESNTDTIQRGNARDASNERLLSSLQPAVRAGFDYFKQPSARPASDQPGFFDGTGAYRA